jgi:tetratricopeptide (TPR) repeat protein
MKMQSLNSARLRITAPVLIFLLFSGARNAVTQGGGPQGSAPGGESLEEARQGLDLLMNGQPDPALEIFRRVQHADPNSPLGDLLVADALWWKIYYATGNLIDPDVFDVVRSETSPYDAEFHGLAKSAARKAESRIQARQDVARDKLYLGMAYALEARLEGMRGHDLPAARASKKMRAALLEAVANDPELNDAYLGMGIYNYFVDTLPTIVKIIRWFIGLPGGDREIGLEQIERTASKGDLARAEAEFYLAKDFSRDYEGEYSRSLQLFQELAREYPRNGLWTLLIASLEIRLGQVAEGEALYRQVLQETAGEETEAGRAFHRAAKLALMDQHPNDKAGQ